MGQHNPTNFRVLTTAEDSDKAGGATPGGYVKRGTAGMTLEIGDYVVLVPGIMRWFKTLGNSYYAGGCQTGIVVGGERTYFTANLDSGAIGVDVATVGQDVLVMTKGVCYALCDATGIKAGQPIAPGATTAGRILGGRSLYFAESPAGLKISAGTATVAEAANAARTTFAGAPATALTAGVDMAALAGTVEADLFGLWEQRVAANATTVTTAAGSLVATSKAGLTLPAGAAALITLGFIIVNPTGTGDFVGGTTGLADGTVVPNTEYYDLVGSYQPRGLVLEDGGAAAAAILVELF